VVLFLWYEAFRTLFGPQGFQVSIGSLLWFLNIVLLSAYTFSCHSFRHLIGATRTATRACGGEKRGAKPTTS
jgi:4-amino-4-deoxy-L-arabinose transferase-like glycosyltransferase